ncbi:MAG: ABC transporter ATP-binding protein [bacterium]|nr:ABC transporter ATP-binding protein [bacterium]
MCSDASETPAIRVRQVSKCFQLYEKPIHRLWQMLWHGKKTFYRTFRALDDISFDVQRGECVGIIGRNGAGKSTLLQIITGTLAPTSGTVEMTGRVAALLELGSGFNPEFTGRENIWMNAAILGLSEKEIAERYDDIVAFAEIGDFIEQPVKSYSSGMVVRLAFAVIAHVDADVLIIDEALAVGDALFTQKCMRFLRNFMANHTVLFVSHDIAAVNSLCQRAILLSEGKMHMIGSAKEVTEKYLEMLFEGVQGKSELEAAQKENVLPPAPVPEDFRDMRQDLLNASPLRNDIQVFSFSDEHAFGKGGAVITQVLMTDLTEAPLNWVVGGEMVRLVVHCQALQPLFSPIVGFYIKDRLGQNLFGDNTFLSHLHHPLHLQPGQRFSASFTFRMPILPSGEYVCAAALAEGTQEEHVQHCWIHDALVFNSQSTSVCTGLIGIPMRDIRLGVDSPAPAQKI